MKYIKLFENFDFDEIGTNEHNYLVIKESQIPNSGMGLFTLIPINKNEIISRYTGEILSDKEAEKRVKRGDDEYFMSLPSGKMFDTKLTGGFAKYANDAEGLQTKFKNNSFISLDDDDGVILVAKRNIKSGEEIFTGYGKKYWNKYKKENR